MKKCLKCHVELKFSKKDYCYTCSRKINNPDQANFKDWYMALHETRSQIGLKYRDLNATDLLTAFDMVLDKSMLITAKEEVWKLKIMDFAERMTTAWSQKLIPDYFDECCNRIRESDAYIQSKENGIKFIDENMPFLSSQPGFIKMKNTQQEEVPF